MDISKEELNTATNILSSRLSHTVLDELLYRYLPPQLINEGESGINGTKWGKASLLVEARGSELLADVDLRKSLIRGDPGIATILVESSDSPTINLDEVAIKSWHPGKNSAKEFAQTLGFPDVFAGLPGGSKPQTLVEITPPPNIPSILDFQKDVVEQILDVLEKKDGHEAMISLPTGAGKTRVAMETILQFQDKHEEGFIIWLATTGEVCEQACQTYLQLREARRPSTTHQLHRYWGNRDFNFKFERGLMVASVQKLRSQIEMEAFPYHILKRIQAIFFDEGHHAVAPTYEKTINYLEQASEGSPVPIIGLSATPGRGSDPASQSSRRLARRFGRRLIIPRGPGWNDPVRHLQNEGILSEVENIVIRTNRRFNLTKRMAEHWEEFREFSPEFLQRMSRDIIRNIMIVDQICKQASKRKGIVFACSVEHAEHLAFLLRRAGRPSATVSAETRPVIRHRNLKLFREGNLDFITNFGILTTGFDVPSINVIVLARPVTSQVLYEQMIGRGLRGPKFGGTEECLILDFEDNIEYHGEPLAYRRFRWLWEPPISEDSS